MGEGLVVWVDANGNTTGKAYGELEGASINSITGTPDGGCVTAGYIVDSNYSDYHDAWFLRLDESGNIVWETRYSGIGTAIANCVTRANDGNFVAAGETSSQFYVGDTIPWESCNFVITLDAST
jgi:hypothetical protein